MLTNIQIKDIANQTVLICDLTDSDLVEFCSIANQKYRDGNPITCLLYTSPSPRDS